MKRLAIVVALALTACATTGGVPSTGVSDVIGKIRQYAVIYCSFEPDISSVSQILATLGGPGAVAGEAVIERIAKSICAAVVPIKTAEADFGLSRWANWIISPAFAHSEVQIAQNTPPLKVQPASKAKGTPPKVNGVVVHGKFVK